MNIAMLQKIIVRLLVLCVVLLCGACSMVTGKTRLDKFLDGDNPEKTVVVKSKPKKDTHAMAMGTQKGDVQLTSLVVEGGGGDDAQATIADIVVAKNNNPQDKYSASRSLSQKSAKNKQLKKDKEMAAAAALEEAEKPFRCHADDDPSFAYRKRVGVLPMGLEQRLDVVDVPFIERQYSQELVRRMRSDALLPFDASNHYVGGQYAFRELLSPEQARAMASQLGVQFLVAGRLVDLSFEPTQTYAIDLALSAAAWKTWAKETYERATDSQWRELNVELAVYDGPSGALIKQDIYKGGANQRINTDRYSGLDSNRFWQSDYGQLLSKVLNDQAKMVERSVECLPMRAQVLSVRDAHIEINAGVDTLLMPGDKLKLFHRAPTGQVRDNENAYRWQYFGEVTVAGVFPMRAVAMLDEDLPLDVIRAGDIVQAW